MKRIEKVPTKLTILQSFDKNTIADAFINSRSKMGFERVTEDGTEFIKTKDGNKSVKEFDSECLGMNTQLTRLPQFLFQVQCSNLFRDFILTHCWSAWAVSNRQLNYARLGDDWKVPISSEYFINEEIRELVKPRLLSYVELIENSLASGTADKDESIHSRIPYEFSTSIQFVLNLKEVYALTVLMQDYFPVFYNNYGVKFLEVISEVNPSYSEHYKNHYDLYRGDDIYQRYFTDTYKNKKDPINVGELTMSIYSQFMRQSDSVSVGFYDLIKHSNEDEFFSKEINGSTIVNNVIWVASDTRVRRTISARSCWFSKSNSMDDEPNSWSKIITSYFKHNNIGVVEMLKGLPCGGDCKKCRFEIDMRSRITREEFLTPCAILLESKELAVNRYNEVPNTLNKMYLDAFNYQYVKDNTKNKLRKIYESR